jgi:putative addiction module component (TIGR02574 family)
MTGSIYEVAKKLPINERVKLVEDLWETIVEEGEGTGVPEMHQKLLDDRLEEHRLNPNDVITMEELEADLDQTFGPIKM